MKSFVLASERSARMLLIQTPRASCTEPEPRAVCSLHAHPAVPRAESPGTMSRNRTAPATPVNMPSTRLYRATSSNRLGQ